MLWKAGGGKKGLHSIDLLGGKLEMAWHDNTQPLYGQVQLIQLGSEVRTVLYSKGSGRGLVVRVLDSGLESWVRFPHWAWFAFEA